MHYSGRRRVSDRKLHLVLAVAWGGMLVPTLLWWKESILWVAFMSLYANVVGHWSAYQAARAEEANGDASVAV
jgi:hypothetical protein